MAVDKGMTDKLDQSRQTDTLGSKGALEVNELLLPTTSPSFCLVLSHHSQLPPNCPCYNLGSAGLFLCSPYLEAIIW